MSAQGRYRGTNNVFYDKRRRRKVWTRRQQRVIIRLITLFMLATCQVHISRTLWKLVSEGRRVMVSSSSSRSTLNQTGLEQLSTYQHNNNNNMNTTSPGHFSASLSSSSSSWVPPTLLLLQRYIQQHSHTALLQESGSSNTSHRRRYAIGYYSCPQQAGNRLHHLFNAFVWGVVLNRTVLVHYYAKEACRIVGNEYDPGICQSANQQEDCDAILGRHEWIPMFEDWKDRLGLPDLSQRRMQTDYWKKNATTDDKILQLNFWSTRGPAGTATRRPWRSEFEGFLHIDLLVDVPVVDFPQMLSQEAKLFTRGGDKNLVRLLATPQARERARALMAMGRDYLYGMLFRHIFDFQPSVLSPPTVRIPENAFLIGLHSRHIADNNNGSNVTREVYCMDQVLLEQQEQKGDTAACLFFLMSDRPETLALLAAHAKTRNCTALIAPKSEYHTTSSTAKSSPLSSSWRLEHGPHSGIGYYQDLAFLTSSASIYTSTAPPVQQSLDAFIGSHRSSSLLVQELIEFDRHTNKQRKRENNNQSTPSLITCRLFQ